MQKVPAMHSDTLVPFYIFASDEILLLNEAVDNIRQCAKKQGFLTRKNLDEHTDIYSGSLFAEKEILECHLTGKISGLLQKTIEQLLAKPPRDKIIIITTGQKPPAFLKKNATVLYPIQPRQFPAWVKKRLLITGFDITPSALALLCQYTDNNLLAVVQCIEKLVLLQTPSRLTETEILSVISPSSRYTVFDLANTIKEKKLVHLKSILDTLRADGTEPAIVLWAIAREARTQKQFGYLLELSKIDDMIKGITPGRVWPALERASFAIAGRKIL